MLGLYEHMPFVFVNDELGFDAESFQCVPEFVRLRRRTFAIAVADDDQSWRFCVLYKSYRRTFSVHLGIIVNGFSEERNHPLIDFIFAVVALVIGDARTGHSGFEAIGLRNGPHGHIAAIAPAGNAEVVGIDRRDFDRFVDAGKNVAKIAVTEIPGIGAGEGFSVTKAATRIRLQ